jgi:hypothetical protein
MVFGEIIAEMNSYLLCDYSAALVMAKLFDIESYLNLRKPPVGLMKCGG